jgi:hypothetical protein
MDRNALHLHLYLCLHLAGFVLFGVPCGSLYFALGAIRGWLLIHAVYIVASGRINADAPLLAGS